MLFWEDVWLGHHILAQQYPTLYNIANRKQVSVATALAQPLNITFHRALTGNKWDNWLHLVERLMQVNLADEQDVFVWRLTSSGMFTVISMYLDILNGQTRFPRKYIWKIKVPLNIKIFMWFLYRKVILTKDNLVKRNWNGNKCCCLCDNTTPFLPMSTS